MLLPNFNYEKDLWNKDYEMVAGCDEVGRGCFAGPVVAGCVAFPSSFKGPSPKAVRIDDSKRMTAKQREIADKWIKENAIAWGIGEASTNEINKKGISKATNLAFGRAIVHAGARLGYKIDYLLTDAFYIPRLISLSKKKQFPIIKGDQKSISIAAASIIAKVYRDNLMIKKSKNPNLQIYKWNTNKGYGTKEHREAIFEFGITKYHRKQFVATFFSKTNN